MAEYDANPPARNHAYYVESMKARCQDLLTSGRYSDCEFLVGPEGNQRSFEAHKILLAIASPVWDSMLLGLLQEKGQVKIVDVDPNAFQLMLNFVYLKEVEFNSVNEAIDVYYVADKYIMTDLIQYCTEYIYMEINTSNVWPVLQFALEFGDENIEECALKLISQKTNDAFKSEELKYINLSTLEAVLEMDNLNADSELVIFDGAVSWAQEECRRGGISTEKENVRLVLKEAWNALRLLTLTPAEFAKGPAKSGLLTLEEISSIFIYKHSGEEESSPPTISANTTKRELEDSDRCFKELHMYDLPLVVPLLYECDGKRAIVETFEVTADFEMHTIVIPCQAVSIEALSSRYSEFQSKGYYKEKRETSYSLPNHTGESCTNSHLAWNDEEKIRIVRHDRAVLKKGDNVAFTFHLETAGWYPLTLASSHRNLKLISSDAGKTHCFLKRTEK